MLANEPPTQPAPFPAGDASDVRSILFFGSLNVLYAEGLRVLYAAIKRWNDAPPQAFSLRLTLLVSRRTRGLDGHPARP